MIASRELEHRDNNNFRKINNYNIDSLNTFSSTMTSLESRICFTFCLINFALLIKYFIISSLQCFLSTNLK